MRLAQLEDRVVVAVRGAVEALAQLGKETLEVAAGETLETIHMLEGLVVDIAVLVETMVELVAKDTP